MGTGQAMVVAAFWAETDDIDATTDTVRDALKDIAIPESGGVGAFHEAQVDDELRRDIGLIAAEFRPASRWRPSA